MPLRTPLPALLAACAALAACGDTVSARIGSDDGASTAAFGANDRVAVTVDAAQIEAVNTSAVPPVIDVRAALPWPTFRLQNGVFEETTVTLRVSNIGADARFQPTLRTLSIDARRDPRCEGIESASAVALADLVTTRTDDPNNVTLSLELPPCSELTIDVTVSNESDSIEIVFAGSTEGSTHWFDDALAAAQALDVALLYVVGGAADDSPSPYRDVIARAEAATIPVSFGIGRSDRQSLNAWQRAFSPANATVRIGDAYLVTLDSTAGRLDGRQRALLDALGTTDNAAIVAMAVPPFDPGGVDRFGWRSPVQAAALVQQLASRGVDLVVASNHRQDADRAIAGVHLVNLAGARRDDRVWLRATIDHPIADVDACDTSTTCTENHRCVTGWCRIPCDDDADCPEANACDSAGFVCRPRCGEGCSTSECTDSDWCIDTPRVTWTVEPFDAPDAPSPQ